LVGALISAFVVAGAATSAHGFADRQGIPDVLAAGATCTSAERARNQGALATYRKAMPRQRAAYFRNHKNPRQRAKFVKGQQERLATLQKAAACRVPPATTQSTTTAASTSTTPVSTASPTTSTTTSTPTTTTSTTTTTTSSTTTTTAGRTKAVRALEFAEAYLGTPFVYGGSTPQTGFDSSGLVQWAYAQVGVALPRVANDQFLVGAPVAREALRAGDLVFFRDTTGYVFHVGMCVEGDRFIHAPHTGDVIKFSSLTEPYYADQFAGGRRVAEG